MSQWRGSAAGCHQLKPSWAQVFGTQTGLPQTPGVPPPPQVCPVGQAPHWRRPPHPSPVGPHEIASWAQRTGRYLPAGSAPQPGDLILFGSEHVGLVESVNPDGSLTTIEGNSSDAVSRVHRMPGEATGYVRL